MPDMAAMHGEQPAGEEPQDSAREPAYSEG
jgi:hypothetical protein